jgi:hypothetical protein
MRLDPHLADLLFRHSNTRNLANIFQNMRGNRLTASRLRSLISQDNHFERNLALRRFDQSQVSYGDERKITSDRPSIAIARQVRANR